MKKQGTEYTWNPILRRYTYFLYVYAQSMSQRRKNNLVKSGCFYEGTQKGCQKTFHDYSFVIFKFALYECIFWGGLITKKEKTYKWINSALQITDLWGGEQAFEIVKLQ